MNRPARRRLIVCADDFGRAVAINRAVEDGHRNGILTCASLMVGAPAAADAVARARALPSLKVGLHVVLVDGHPVSPPDAIPGLVGTDGAFSSAQLRAGVEFFFRPGIRRQLAREIRAQFEEFRATGLALDHVNAHKHMHLHPTVARLIVEIGRDYGMRAMRLPFEPALPLGAAETLGARALRLWTETLRRRLDRAGIRRNDQLFGLAWSGAVTEPRVLGLLEHLPAGVSELYCHPAIARDAALEAEMPGYRHVEEFAALVSPAVRARVDALGIALIGFADLAETRA
ncbi:MAG: hopanoid biosynthesis-associated protein HpnK [Proteobacteria bacterium]|nr:hopanoid biosynthesis-associated protein HpnK [Pseudomonadota bacterium]